ncbi:MULTISPECIES: molybdopterin-dependent oxidoreductase [Clostridia]|uniref:molybdopterin-dependent oxidoreductase n=1 Tax=Clostridia TaxID=186801 RepID=UPI000EA01DA7|nr:MULTISPECIES: molybdopterin-dependent oxidoreductase [Clostridia]NBJ70004.1 dimethyl sulfoxide reductase subunit A [Roseburia sp. 1XD42-34]RKI77371.1 dimethyl sulfoxide reductase subunit A [Clostridium sp. 1xD42-85]
MFDLMSKLKNYKMSRRAFVGWSAAVTAAAAIPVSRGLKTKAELNKVFAASEGNEVWKSAACWHNCGGRCVNKVLVKDNVVIRQKTDDTHEDSPDYPQQRGCLRGRSQRQQVFGADRLKYPMKRKNWKPGGGKKELRGKDQWVRISWDEALDIVASEMKRIAQKHGNNALWATGSGEITKVLSENGGCTTDYGTTSWGAWFWASTMMGVAEGWEELGINDRIDLRNSQLIVLWGVNPAWSSPGSPTYNYLQAKKAGAHFISIDPKYTESAQVFGADWVPIRPGTDDALAFGMMYTLLDEDDPKSNPLIDWDFLNRCTVGFDKEHMPKGANPKDNFKDYLLGTYDNEPKTPEWAAEICGVEPEKIRELARKIGSTERVALLTGWAPARINNGEGWVQAFSTLGFMTGHMGRSGRMTGVSCHRSSGNGGHWLVNKGENGYPQPENPVTDSINHNEIFPAILEGKFHQKGEGERKANIQLIYHQFNATLQTRSTILQGIQAHRKVEFVVTHAYTLTTNAKYSDVVLPVTTEWEREGGLLVGNREILIAHTNIVEPMYEAKSDVWIAKELMKKLGKDPKKLYPFSEKQAFFNELASSTVIKENGKDYEPLVGITARDIKEWGVEGKPQKGRISLQEFLEKGVYQVKRKPGDNFGYIAYQDFVEKPDKHPLETPSGKFEIYCNTIAEESKGGWTEVSPIPKYVPKARGYEATFADWQNKKKGKYSFQVFNPHYLRRSHSTFDNVPWLREAMPNPVFISKKDAKELGIKDGDTVLLSNEYGKTLRPAKTTETLMPGTVALPHGAWVEMDEKEEVDKAGADNMLTAPIATGLGTSGWNTVICHVEKYQGDPLIEDAKWEQRIFFPNGEV